MRKILFSETQNEDNKVLSIGDMPPTNIEEWGNEIASKLPYWSIICAAIFGDVLKRTG
jgi:hypothetical protein